MKADYHNFPKIASSLDGPTSPERARSALSHLSPETRDVWVRQAMAIKSEYGDDGFEIWDQWSSLSSAYHANDARDVWKSVKAGKGIGIGIGTLFYDAKQAGWQDDTAYKKPSAAELEQRRQAKAKRDAEAAAQEAAGHEAAAARAHALWEAATPCDTHPYLERKGVKSHGLRYGSFDVERTDEGTGEVTVTSLTALVVPIRDRTKKIWTLQAISEKPGGAKLLLKGGRKSGNFCVIGSKPLVVDGKPVFVLVEGYATGASVHEATGHLVLMCVDSGNLSKVAAVVRERHADAIIVVAADNDLWGRRHDGRPSNPGLEAAQKVADAVGALVVAPPFTENDKTGTDDKGNATGPTDWNDWCRLKGGQSVAQVIAEALARPMTVVLAPDRQAAAGAAIAMLAVQQCYELPGDTATFVRKGPSDLVVQVYGGDLAQRATELRTRYPCGNIFIMARPGEELAASSVADAHGACVETLAEFGAGEFDSWFDAMMAAFDTAAEANHVALVTARQVLDQSRSAPVQDDGGAAGSATVTQAGENDKFAVDPKAPFDIAHQLIARNWREEGRRTLHRTGGAFYRWKGTHYEEMKDESVRATLYRELDNAYRLEDDAPFKPNASSVNQVEDALRAAAHLPGERPSECWIDGRGIAPASEIIAVQNGLLHMPARGLLPRDPNFFTLNSLPFNYDADASQPGEWLDFLATIWPNDPESIGLLQRWFGYMLSADTGHQKLLLLIGPKRSGKGTIARIMTSLLGKANVAGPSLSDFSHQFGLAQLIGRRAAIIGDARMSARSDQGEIAGRLLSITGEDVLTIDRKHREPWIGTLPTRIVICSNELPRLQDASGALSSRFLILQMEQSFYGKEDRGLSERIERELPGILRWSLDGWDALQREGRFTSPQSSMDALLEIEGLSSPVKAFIADVCVVDALAAIDCNLLYREWCGWCKSQGRDHAGTLQTFGRDLRAAAAGVKTQQYRVGDGSRPRRFVGVGLRSPI